MGDPSLPLPTFRPMSILAKRSNISATAELLSHGLGCVCLCVTLIRCKGKGKGLPYSIPIVGPGADPGVQAVSPQVTVNHTPGAW